MNPEKNILKMRFIASFYLLVFVSALISMGLFNSQRVFNANAGDSRVIAKVTSQDSIPLGKNLGSDGESAPAGISAKEESTDDKTPIDFSLDLPTLLKWVFGYSAGKLSSSVSALPSLNNSCICLRFCNIRI